MRNALLLSALVCWSSLGASRVNITWYNSSNLKAPNEYAEMEGDGSSFTNLIPRGAIMMWAGNVTTNFDNTGLGTNGALVGWALCNGTNGAPDLTGQFIKGWTHNVNPLGTGGGPYTPQGSVAAPTISGSTASESSHTHSVTAAGTVTITNNTTGVTTANESAHTHSVTAAGTVTITNTVATGTFTGSVPNKTNVMTVAAGPAAIRQVATNGAATPAGTITIDTHGHTNSFNATSVTSGAGSAHNHTINDSGHGHTNAFTGSAVTSGAGSSHLHGSGTLSASAPAFTGTQATVEPAYVRLAYIIKL